MQDYNAQAAATGEQIVAAAEVTNAANDTTQLEPIFGDIKTNRGYQRFARRGLTAVTSEWKPICTAHNLRKLWRNHQTTPAPGF